METLLGIAMVYAWVHATVIIFKKVERTTQYEKAVLIVGLVGFILIVLNIATS